MNWLRDFTQNEGHNPPARKAAGISLQFEDWL